MEIPSNAIDIFDKINRAFNSAYALAVIAANPNMDNLPQEVLSDYFFLLSEFIQHGKEMFQSLMVRGIDA